MRDEPAIDIDQLSTSLVATSDPEASRQLRELETALGCLSEGRRAVILLVRRPTKIVLRRSVESAQYAVSQYRDILQAAAITQSMSRKANCWDNAPMESGTLKTELVHHREYPDRNTAAQTVRLYRRLLQSCADPLRHRLHHPTAGRGRSRITPCPLFRGKVTQTLRIRSSLLPSTVPPCSKRLVSIVIWDQVSGAIAMIGADIRHFDH